MNRLSEQDVVDWSHSLRHPMDQYSRRTLNDCGHYNCQLHGLCAIVEIKHILGRDWIKQVDRIIDTNKRLKARRVKNYVDVELSG